MRSNFFDQEIISDKRHLKFAKNLKTSTDRKQFLAIRDNEKIGVAYLTDIDMSKLECELGLYVNPFSEAKHKGSDIMTALLMECKRVGIKKINLKVFEKNSRAIELYRKFGFVAERLKDGVIGMSLVF